MDRVVRRIAVLAMLVLAIVGLSSLFVCSGTQAKTTLTFIYWVDPQAIGIWNNIIKGFEKENPDIEIKAISNPADYWTKILTMIAARQAPDVMMMDYIYFPDWVTAGRLENLQPYIERDKFNISDVWEVSRESLSYEGKLYGMPMDVNNQVIFYNKNLFKQAGLQFPDGTWTWAEFLKVCQALTKDQNGDGKPDQYGFSIGGLYWEPMAPWVWNNNADFFNKERTKCILNEPNAVESIQFLGDLMNKYNVTPSPTREQQMGMGTDQLFLSGKLGMWGSGYWQVSQLRTVKDFGWDVAPLPYKLKVNGTPLRSSTLGGVSLCILSSSKNKEAAWKFIKYRLRKDVQIQAAGLGLSMPALKSVAMSQDFLKYTPPDHTKYCIEAMSYTRPFPTFPGFQRIDTEVLGPTLELLSLGKRTAQEVCNMVTEKANEIMKGSKPFRR